MTCPDSAIRIGSTRGSIASSSVPVFMRRCDSAASSPTFTCFGDYHWALAKGDRMRVILVDLPAGTTVAITIDVEDAATLDALVAETMPIVETFDFK